MLEHTAGLTPVGGNLSPMVEVTRFAQKDGGFELIHLINGSGHFGVSFFEPVTMADVEVVVDCTQKPDRVWSLVSQGEVESTWHDGRLTIHIPSLGLFDAIRVE